jgi:serine protease Do
MEHTAMRTVLTRGRAALLLSLSAALPLGAQGVGSMQMSRRDSTVFLRVLQPSKATIDSITTLMRALEVEPLGSTAAVTLRRQIDALLPSANTLLFTKRGTSAALPQGWVGFTAQGPKKELLSQEGDFIQYFAYPSIIAVDPESPAQRAGIEPGDVLIAYNGLDVRGREFNLTQLLAPERKLSVTIRRDGEMKDYAVTVVKAPERVFRRRLDFGAVPVNGTRVEAIVRGDDGPSRVQMPMIAVPRGMGPGGGMISSLRMLMAPNGAFGAVLSNVSPELAKTLKLETGVLVNDVSDESPATKAGLHTGDVIVGAGGQSVTSLRALHEAIAMHLQEQSIVLQVMRDRKPRKLSVSW